MKLHIKVIQLIIALIVAIVGIFWLLDDRVTHGLLCFILAELIELNSKFDLKISR